VNWDLLERRIASNEKAYQRQIIRKKIDELVQYYEQCRQARDLPSIPGAVIISCDEKLRSSRSRRISPIGTLKVPEREGILRAIDGQHRLLALHADIDGFGDEMFTVPAVIFDRLPDDHVVQMFVTINAKHTRLNASHLVSLSGRQLYRDENLAAAHDIVRALNDREDSPLYGEIKLLGVGKGRVAQAPLAQELKKLFAAEAFGAGRKGRCLPRGVEEVLRELPEAGRGGVRRRVERPQVQHQVGDGAARVHPRGARRRPRLDQEHAERTDFRAIGRVIAPWGRRIGDLRFETDGAWKRSGTTVDSLAKELRLALQYPEGAAVYLLSKRCAREFRPIFRALTPAEPTLT
jgi:DGQHR domain-containing protein